MQLADSPNPQLQTMALDALDRSICSVLGSDQFQENISSNSIDASNDVRIYPFSLYSSVSLGIMLMFGGGT